MWQKPNFFIKTLTLHKILQTRLICITPINYLNQKWRKERGFSVNPNACGILTDGADFTFLDGRPTPYGVRQRNRILRQRAIAEQIIKLTAEVDFAVDRHKKLQEEEENRRKQIIANKLKPKGIRLLMKK